MRRFLALTMMFLINLPFIGTVNATPAHVNQVKEAQKGSAQKIHLKTIAFNPSQALPEIPRSLDKTGYGNQEKGLYLVQFIGPVQAQWKTDLIKRGVVVGDYIPDNSFVVKMTNKVKEQISELGFVQEVSVYKPAYKVDNKLKDDKGLVQETAKGNDQAQLSLSLFPGADLESFNKTVKSLKGQVIGAQDGRVTINLKRDQIAALAANNDITYIEERPVLQLFNDKAATIVGAPTLWSNSLDGTGQVVGIADTGLDKGVNDSTMHQDFQGKIDAIFSLGGNSTADTHGHGTHVAGSVLGNGARSGGQYKGMAPGAHLVFQAAGTNLTGIPSDLSQLFGQAYNAGARIHSDSWGSSPNGAYDSMARSVDNFMWNNDNMTIVFAAGNSGQQNGATVYQSVSSPGTAKNVITVGASENNRPEMGSYADNINSVAAFSSRGNTADGRSKPDVVAPGTYIYSTKSSLTSGTGYYTYMSGTSMATPITAGSVALLRQYYMSKLQVTPKPSLLKATLINGAVDMGYGFPSRDQGWGRISLGNSLYPTNSKEMRYVNETTALSTGGSQEYTYNVETAGVPLKATLVWTDYPGSTAASKALVNDLDLTVISPSGVTYKGNDFAAPYNDTVDRLNNVENVLINTPEVGTYRFIVNGYNVPSGPQDFSLVTTGDFTSSSTTPVPTPAPTPTPTPTPTPDTTAPTVSITAPANSSTITGSAAVQANASDNVGVSKIEFLVDNAVKSTDTTSPYGFTLDTTSLTNGQHQITAKAYDAAGNTGTSTVTVTVSNQTQSDVTTQTQQGTVSSTATPRYKDYFIDVPQAGDINLKLSWTGTTDLDLYLYNSSGTMVASSAQLSNPESLKYTAPAAGKYQVRVYAYSGSASYTLNMSYPAGSSTGQTPPPTQTGTYTDTRAITNGYSVTYTITVGANGTLNASVGWDIAASDLDLYLYAPDGTIAARATTSTANPETLSATVAPGTYKVKVTAYSGNATYNLRVTYPQ